jgi:hypothetical protein
MIGMNRAGKALARGAAMQAARTGWRRLDAPDELKSCRNPLGWCQYDERETAVSTPPAANSVKRRLNYSAPKQAVNAKVVA